MIGINALDFTRIVSRRLLTYGVKTIISKEKDCVVSNAMRKIDVTKFQAISVKVGDQSVALDTEDNTFWYSLIIENQET